MRRLTAAIVVALTVAALTAAPAHAAAAPGFYDPPVTLPHDNGAIVRSEPMHLGASVRITGTTRALPGTATRLMYRSTDAVGSGVGVTGVYIEPTLPWRGSGARPLVAFAAGTQGQGDSCAPSKSLESVVVVDADGTGFGYEIPSIYGLLSRGIAVVVTDYVGLGTTDRVHSYTTRLDMGHALLDAARAALRLPGTSVDGRSPIGLYGYSQGGGASASAAELAPSYAPELNLRGAYAGAPPADLFGVLKTADGSSLTGVVGYAFNGILQYYPEAKSFLQTQLNGTGADVLRRVSTQCIGETLLTAGFASTSSWTRSGQSFLSIATADAATRRAVEDQRIGTLRPAIPVQVLTGTRDDIVQHAQAKQLAADWCAKGADVTYVPVVQPLPSGGTGTNHLVPAFSRIAPSQQWLVDRLQGVPATSNCGALAALP